MFGFRRRKREKQREQLPSTMTEFEAFAQISDEESAQSAQSEDEFIMTVALERLRSRHLPFRRADKSEESELEDLRLQILTAATDPSAPEDYYQEAWNGRMPATTGSSPANTFRRIAVMQVELISRAFYTLQLHRFANARENSGWMNLFRMWGMSPRFNDIVEELEPTLPMEVATFYRLYLRYIPPARNRTRPMAIHHPWLTPPGAVGRGLYMDSGRMEAEMETEAEAEEEPDVRPGAGGVTDARGSSEADQSYEKPADSGDPESGGSGPAPNT